MNKNFKSLGHIDKDDRKDNCWNEKTISGSRFSKWVLEPHKYNETDDLSFIAEKLEWGNELENIIKIKTIEKLGEYHKSPSYEINNFNSYQRTDYDFCYANIDYCFINEFDIPVLMEIKNSETKNFNVLKERYKYQMMYYCWFFNVREIYFSVLIAGCSLKYEKITFDDADFELVENYIKEFKEYLKTGKLPKRETAKINVGNDELKESMNSYETLIKQIEIKKNELQELETKLDFNKNNILEFLKSKDDIFSVNSDNFIFSQKIQKGRETWDSKKLNEYFDKNHIEANEFKNFSQDKIILGIKNLKE